VSVLAPHTTARVTLEVDGAKVGQTSRPFSFQWRLTPGQHRLVAVGPSGERSPPVQITVRPSGNGVMER
jgi:hypothetical protein